MFEMNDNNPYVNNSEYWWNDITLKPHEYNLHRNNKIDAHFKNKHSRYTHNKRRNFWLYGNFRRSKAPKKKRTKNNIKCNIDIDFNESINDYNYSVNKRRKSKKLSRKIYRKSNGNYDISDNNFKMKTWFNIIDGISNKDLLKIFKELPTPYWKCNNLYHVMTKNNFYIRSSFRNYITNEYRKMKKRDNILIQYIPKNPDGLSQYIMFENRQKEMDKCIQQEFELKQKELKYTVKIEVELLLVDSIAIKSHFISRKDFYHRFKYGKIKTICQPNEISGEKLIDYDRETFEQDSNHEMYCQVNENEKFYWIAEILFEKIYDTDHVQFIPKWNENIDIQYHNLNDIIQETNGYRVTGYHIPRIIVWIISQYINSDYHYYSIKINGVFNTFNAYEVNSWKNHQNTHPSPNIAINKKTNKFPIMYPNSNYYGRKCLKCIQSKAKMTFDQQFPYKIRYTNENDYYMNSINNSSYDSFSDDNGYLNFIQNMFDYSSDST